MFKGLVLGLAALGLVAPAVVEARPGYYGYQKPYKHYNNRGQFYRYNLQPRRNFYRFPRCNRWEIAVRHPYRPGRFICLDRRGYNDYRSYYRY